MTNVLITVDTELSSSLLQRGFSLAANIDSSIWGRCKDGTFGIGWQMDRLEAHGLKGVFFVDPLPTLVYGPEFLSGIVSPICARGHEVQLHIHTEWLQWAKQSPVGVRTGRDIADFSLEDQIMLLGLAADMLQQAGAPRPTAFRAGNYGADDNSLRALAGLGLEWDSSVNPPYLGSACRISASPELVGPARMHGMIELPVAGIHDRPGSIRPAQICALSSREMRDGLSHSAQHDHAAFVIVTHSFEMLSRDRTRGNHAVMRRFETMCETIASNPKLHTSGFHDLDPAIADRPAIDQSRAGSSRIRTALRIAEQALATWRYERQWLPV